MKTLRLLVLISWNDIGGSTTLAAELVQRLRRAGHQVTPVVVHDKDQPAHPDLGWRSLHLQGSPWQPLALLRGRARLLRLLQAERCQLVLSLLLDADLIAAASCAALGIPHLSYIVDRRNWLSSPRLRDRLKRALLRGLHGLARTRYLAISAAAGEFAACHLRIAPERLRLARNAVDVQHFDAAAVPAGGIVRFGTLSRLVGEKGLELVLQAAAELQHEGIGFSLVLGGTGPARAQLEALVATLGLQQRVTLCGRVEDARELYASIDIFVVPSVDSEGLPTTILEAMAMRRVVLASDVGGAAEVISGDGHGRLVEPRSVPALARAMADLARLAPQQREAIGTAARVVVERGFTYERLLDDVLQGCHEAVASAACTPKWDERHGSAH